MANANEAVAKFQSTAIWDEAERPSFRVDMTLRSGEFISKNLSYESYREMLFGAQKEEIQWVSMETPKYYVKGTTSTQEGTFKVFLFVPGARRQFVAPRFKMITQVPYPNLLFYLRYVGGRCEQRYCFAVKDDVVTEKTKLYRYPYGNVSLDGAICMGNISTKIDSLKHADQFVDAFFDGEDEGHYYTPGKMAKPNISQSTLIERVKERESFPKEWLVSNGKTFGEMVKYFAVE